MTYILLSTGKNLCVRESKQFIDECIGAALNQTEIGSHIFFHLNESVYEWGPDKSKDVPVTINLAHIVKVAEHE